MKENNTKKSNVTENGEKEILSGVRRLRILGIFNIRVFMLVLFAFFIVSLIIPLRPSYSESEKRKLAKFPSFSFSALFSGDYFDGINEWYADTFPFREALTGLNARVSALFGKTDVQIHGTVEQGDEIPDLPSESEDSSSSEQTEHQGTESGESSENQSSESSSQTSLEESQSQTASEQKPPENSTQTLGALLINGDTAYEYYNFVRSTADSYIAAINNAGKLLEGKATVYDIIVPNSMGICAPESITSGINTSDQKKAINYMYSGMNNVKTVPIFDTLKSHRNEYIYFRTDHHWTALGAYYAYCELMKAKGVSPSPLDSFTVRDLQVSAFAVSHDAREPLQFHVTDGAVKFGMLTDTGQVTVPIRQALSGCNVLMLECNYDDDMLKRSSYPFVVRKRIGSVFGHLSNRCAADFLSEFDSVHLTKVIGAHLSETNNLPDLAFRSLHDAVDTGRVAVMVASQVDGFGWTEISG